MFEARGVSVLIDGHHLLKRVSIQIAPGKVVAVLGPNGAGKSTLVKVMCGECVPSEGTVWIDGCSIADLTPVECAQQRAVLPQQSFLTFPFRVLDVVLMGRFPHVKGIESARDYAIAQKALKWVGVAHLEQRVYPTLSGGEQQRVQFARALAQIWDKHLTAGRYLLLDEPTTSLDLSHQHQVLQLARKWASNETGVLCVLHDLNLAAQYADEVHVLKNGEQVASGVPDQVLTPDVVSNAFDIRVQQIIHPVKKFPLIVPI